MPASQISALLDHWGTGDREAFKKLLPLIYNDLRRRARLQLKNEPSDISWQSTELVHELYLGLAKVPPIRWKNRDQFYAFAVHKMRRILVDHARRRGRDKRGGSLMRVSFEDVESGEGGKELNVQLVAFNDRLEELARKHPRQAQVVELRAFGGYSVGETARSLRLSPATIKRDWTEAVDWLRQRLE